MSVCDLQQGLLSLPIHGMCFSKLDYTFSSKFQSHVASISRIDCVPRARFQSIHSDTLARFQPIYSDTLAAMYSDTLVANVQRIKYLIRMGMGGNARHHDVTPQQ